MGDADAWTSCIGRYATESVSESRGTRVTRDRVSCSMWSASLRRALTIWCGLAMWRRTQLVIVSLSVYAPLPSAPKVDRLAPNDAESQLCRRRSHERLRWSRTRRTVARRGSGTLPLLAPLWLRGLLECSTRVAVACVAGRAYACGCWSSPGRRGRFGPPLALSCARAGA